MLITAVYVVDHRKKAIPRCFCDVFDDSNFCQKPFMFGLFFSYRRILTNTLNTRKCSVHHAESKSKTRINNYISIVLYVHSAVQEHGGNRPSLTGAVMHCFDVCRHVSGEVDALGKRQSCLSTSMVTLVELPLLRESHSPCVGYAIKLLE